MKADRSDLEKNLPHKGFYRKSSGDHIYFHLKYQGKDTCVYTKISHSKKVKDIEGDLLTSIKKQLRLKTSR